MCGEKNSAKFSSHDALLVKYDDIAQGVAKSEILFDLEGSTRKLEEYCSNLEFCGAKIILSTMKIEFVVMIFQQISSG